MAIPYLNVQFPHVRSDGGACEVLAYLGRCQVLDVRLAKQFDFRHLGGDLVHSEIMRSEDVSEAFDDLEYLANSVDEAEVYRLRGDIDNRLRQTQNGAVLVLALPPASEMTLTEATELTRRIARLIAGGRRLAIHIAIHDPAMMYPGARNRHAHLFFPRREIEYGELAGPAIRDIFARPMKISAVGNAVTVEGNRWPDFYRRQLQTHFAELGIELVVDPIAPFPGRHWQTEIKRDDPRVQNNRSRTWRLNVQAIHGDPVWLVGKLLRGQSTIRIAELQRLLDRFIDGEGQRQIVLEAVLSHPDIVTLAADPVAEKPRFITTTAVYNSVKRACELVDRAAAAEGPSTICAITAANHSGVVERFNELLGRAGLEGPILVGNNHSECLELFNAFPHARPKVTTIKRALSDLSKMVLCDRPNAKSNSQTPMIIVPRAESVEDQTLAKLLLAAHERGTPLVLLHDQSKRNGIASHRLAAYAADRLASVAAVDDESYADAVERYLRAGLVGPAVQLIAQHQEFGFKAVAPLSDEDAGFDFIVCNNPRRVEGLNEGIRSLRLQQGKLQAPTQLGHPLKPVWLAQGERIVFTRDDCSVRPPRIRAGEVAQILEVDSRRNAIRVALSDGIETIELASFTHFRSAHAILVREARNIDRQYSLCIQVSDLHHVWAALMLAVRCPRAMLVIDPRVAADIPSFIISTQRSLPAALPHQLTLRRDPNAELIAILNGDNSAPLIAGEFEPEQMPEPTEPGNAGGMGSPPGTMEPEHFPEPAPTARIKSPPTVPLHERVRTILDSSARTRRGVDRLREKLSDNDPGRSANAEHILSLWGQDSLMTPIIKLLRPTRQSGQENPLDNLDLPPEIEHLSPREWSDWELYRLSLDLAALQFGFANWPITPKNPDSSDDGVVRNQSKR